MERPYYLTLGGIMKKKLLVAFFAVMSAASVSAFYIKIDNDADGKQKTHVEAIIKTPDGKTLSMRVNSGKERKFRNLTAPIGYVMVRGISGVGVGRIAIFRIPMHLVGKNIKIDVEVDDNGKLYLKLD